MKNIFKKICVGAVAIGVMSSCSDFLDQTSPSELNDENVFNSVFYANSLLNKVYGGLTGDQTYSQYFSIEIGRAHV